MFDWVQQSNDWCSIGFDCRTVRLDRSGSFGRCFLLCGSNNILKCNECVCCGVAAKSVYVSIPLSGAHCSLQAFVRHVVEHAGTVVIVLSVSLPYETYKSTGKDIVVVHTHYIKGFQIMKRNQFCLCRVQGHPATCFCKITVRRSTYWICAPSNSYFTETRRWVPLYSTQAELVTLLPMNFSEFLKLEKSYKYLDNRSICLKCWEVF